MSEHPSSNSLSTEAIAALYNQLRPYPSESQVTECLKELLERRASDEPSGEHNVREFYPPDDATAQPPKAALEPQMIYSWTREQLIKHIVQLHRERSAQPPFADQAEIATVVIKDGEIVSTTIKAPGLPDGEHDLFCAPPIVTSSVTSTGDYQSSEITAEVLRQLEARTDDRLSVEAAALIQRLLIAQEELQEKYRNQCALLEQMKGELEARWKDGYKHGAWSSEPPRVRPQWYTVHGVLTRISANGCIEGPLLDIRPSATHEVYLKSEVDQMLRTSQPPGAFHVDGFKDLQKRSREWAQKKIEEQTNFTQAHHLALVIGFQTGWSEASAPPQVDALRLICDMQPYVEQFDCADAADLEAKASILGRCAALTK